MVESESTINPGRKYMLNPPVKKGGTIPNHPIPSGTQSTHQGTWAVKPPIRPGVSPPIGGFDPEDRGRIQYGTPGRTSIAQVLAIFFLLLTPLAILNPFFLNVLGILILTGFVHYYFIPDYRIVVYENGIYIPISRYTMRKYEKIGLEYKDFVRFSDMEFFYPRSFKLYKGILIPHGLTIKTGTIHYHLPHEFSRVLSKKLRVALKDNFTHLYKGDHCVYIEKDNWDEIEKHILKYPVVMIHSLLLYLGIFLALVGVVAYLAWSADSSILEMDRRILVVVLLDAAMISFYLVRDSVQTLFRKFYNAVFKTWLIEERSDKVPEKVKKAYGKYIKRKINREADVLEIFDLDRKEGMSRSIVVNLVILIQIMLIMSALPSDFFLDHEPDYGDSHHFFPNAPMLIEEDTIIENEIIYINEIKVMDSKLTLRNSTIYGLGGGVLNVSSGSQVEVEDSRFLSPVLNDTYYSDGNRNINHVLEIDMEIPAGSRLVYLIDYAFDYGYDYGYVEITQDGENWTQLAGEYTTTYRNKDAEVGYDDVPGYTGILDWVEDGVSLEGYEGEATIRFLHVTDGHESIHGGNWKLTNIRLVTDTTEKNLEDGWNSLGWTTDSFHRPDFWIDIQGSASFTGCRFERSTGDSPMIMGTDCLLEMADCFINTTAGPGLDMYRATVGIQGSNITCNTGMVLNSSNGTIRESIILVKNYLFDMISSYLILDDPVLYYRNVLTDPKEYSMLDDLSGIASLERVRVNIHTILSNGTNATSIPVIIEKLGNEAQRNDGPIFGGARNEVVVNSATDVNGQFSTELFQGYEFYGVIHDNAILNQHMIKKADAYKITVGDREFYRYLTGTIDMEVIVGEAADLRPDLSALFVDYNETTENATISLAIENFGAVDANNFTISWNHQYWNITDENLSLAAGERMVLNRTVNVTQDVHVEIDANMSVNESDERNNVIDFNYIGENVYYYDESVVVYGDYHFTELHPMRSLMIAGNLSIMDGSLNLSNPGSDDLGIKVAGDLFMVNVMVHSESSSYGLECYGDLFLNGCNMSTGIRFYGFGKIQDCTLNKFYTNEDSSCHIRDSDFIRFYAGHSSDSMIIVDNCVFNSTDLSGSSVSVRNNVIEGSDFYRGLYLRFGSFVVENNRISGKYIGLSVEYGSLTAHDNIIEDCDLGIQIDQQEYSPDIIDIINDNEFNNCQRMLEYAHDFEIEIRAENGKYLIDELYELYDEDKLDYMQYTVNIENETNTVYQGSYFDSEIISPDLVHYYVDGNGVVHYPAYQLTVSKDFYGYHRSSITDLTEPISVTVEKKGDVMLENMIIEPGEAGHILMNFSATSMGKNMSNVKIELYNDGSKITSKKLGKVIAGGDYTFVEEIPLESGVHNISVKITSKDGNQENNEIWKKIDMITADRTIDAGIIDHSILISGDATLRIRDGNLSLDQERNNMHEIMVMEGGTLILDKVTISSNMDYAIKNHGTMECTDTVITDAWSPFSYQMEDTLYQEQYAYYSNLYGTLGEDSVYHMSLNSGIINTGELLLHDSHMAATSIFSSGELTMEGTKMTNQYSDIGVFATGKVNIDDSNLSDFNVPLYLYKANYTVKNSIIWKTGTTRENITYRYNWGYATGGVFSLRSHGMIEGCQFIRASMDMRNSTVDINDNIFSSSPGEEGIWTVRTAVLRNCEGTFTNNIFQYKECRGYRTNSLIIIKNSSTFLIRDNNLTGNEYMTGIICYGPSPQIVDNDIIDMGTGIISYGDTVDHQNNTLINISGPEYIQRYLLTIWGDDGSGNIIEDISLQVFRNGTSMESFWNYEPDALYYNSPLMTWDSSGEIDHYMIWLDSYTIKDGNRTVSDEYNISLSKMRGKLEIVERNATIKLDGNIDKMIVLPMADLGVEIRDSLIPFVYNEIKEIYITVYNNGSVDASDINVDVSIYNEKFKLVWEDHINIQFIANNSSKDVSVSWKVREREFTVVVEVHLGSGVEASERNNQYSKSIDTKEAKKDSKEEEFTYQGLIIIVLILGALVGGAKIMGKQRQERKDAMGTNFDVDEFRKSLKLVGTNPATQTPSGQWIDRDGSTMAGGHEGGTEGQIDERIDRSSDASGMTPPTGGQDISQSPGSYGSMYPELESRESMRVAGVPGMPFMTAEPDVPVARIPGKDICPVCQNELEKPDTRGMISCPGCGWMRFRKSDGIATNEGDHMTKNKENHQEFEDQENIRTEH